MRTKLLHQTRHFGRRALIGLVVLAVLALGTLSVRHFTMRTAGVPVPLPVYDIETTSGNLHLDTPGVIGVPIPVDVNRDGIPDVLVQVDLIDINGVTNPPQLNNIVAPHIQITRIPSAITQQSPSPPLKIMVDIVVVDSTQSHHNTILGFGYDTSTFPATNASNGGSIPAHFSAVVRGLLNFYNPIDAVVDTNYGLTYLPGREFPPVPTTYEGPLALVTRLVTNTSSINPDVFDDAGTIADASFPYRPWPGAVEVTYGTDSTGQHLTYAHTSPKTIDLGTNLKFTSGGTTLNLTGRVDRLPKAIAIDMNSTGTQGSINYSGFSSGRHPDIGAHVTSTTPTGFFDATMSIESLPSKMHAEWNTPAGGGSAHAEFDASGQGIGAIEAAIRNYAGSPKKISEYVPMQQQFVNYQTSANGGEQFISGRLERLRRVQFDQTPDGFTSSVDIGDGELPLLAHFADDERTVGGFLADATSTVSPLPNHIALTVHKPANAAGFGQVIYDTSSSVDADAHLELDPATGITGCGKAGTLCGDLRIRNIPSHLDARFGNLDQFGQGADIDATPRDPATLVAPPDFFVDAVLGPGVLLIPANSATPLVAHAELLGFPRHTRVRMHSDSGGNIDRAEFHTCDWQFAAPTPGCATPMTTADQIGALSFSLRNFMDDQRPANLPPPTQSTPMYATLTARQAPGPGQPLFVEATGKVVNISEVQLRNHDGLFGLRTAIGGGKDLSARVDIDLPNTTLIGNAAITPLPATLDVCFRRPDVTPMSPASTDFTAPCESNNPFNEAQPLQTSPLAFGYNAASAFGVSSDVLFREKGSPDHVLRGSISTDPAHPLPKQFQGYFRMAPDCPNNTNCLPTRATYTSSSQATFHASAQDSLADSVCQDPRVGPNVSATCFKGTLENLPQSASLCFDAHDQHLCDPDNPANNLKVTTTGAPINLTGLEFSSVQPSSTAGKEDVLVATGQVIGIPQVVVGAIKSNSFSINVPTTVGNPPVPNPDLQSVDVVAKNYIAPDPILFDIPAQRSGLPAATQQFSAFGRQLSTGFFFKAKAHIQDIRAVSYSTQLKADGTPLNTKVFTLDFGHGQVIRAYADIVTTAGSILGDVTLNNFPAGLTLCFRGKDPAAASAVNPNFCDLSPDPANKGAFQFMQRPGPSGGLLGVHAFVRQQDSGGGIQSATADIDGIPPIIQGTFDDGGADVGGFAADGTTPQGIQDIAFHLANFDLSPTDSGYVNAPLPQFVPRTVTGGPFPAQRKPGQSFLSAAADDTHFEALGDIGKSGAHLQHVLYTAAPCAKPVSSRGDFPAYPAGASWNNTTAYAKGDLVTFNRTSYVAVQPGTNNQPDTSAAFWAAQTTFQCIRADFVKGVNPIDGTNVNPLYLFANVERGGTHLALNNAGLTDVPPWIQVGITKTLTTEPNDAHQTLRRRCGAQSPSDPSLAEQPGADCMPPLIRFDSATLPTTPALFGRVELSSIAGGNADLNALRTVQPKEQFPQNFFEQDPAAANAPDSIRGKVGTFAPAPGSTAPSRTAVIGYIHIKVPGSLTVDQVQSWGQSDSATQADYFDASDMRFHYAVRDYNQPDPYPTTGGECGGTVPANQTLRDHVVPCLATLGMMLNSFPDGGQMLVGDGVVENGFPIPGELGVDLYDRNNKGMGEHLIQVDAKLSTELSLKASILGGAGATIAAIHGQVLHIPGPTDTQLPDWRCNLQTPADAANCKPTERLRAMIIGDGSKPPAAGSTPPANPPAPAKTPECSPVFCALTYVHVASIEALWDFQPDATKAPARRIDAVIRTNGAKNGMEIAAYDQAGVDRNAGPHQQGALSANGIHAAAFLNADAIDVFFHAGVPLLAGLDFDLVSSLQAGFSLGDSNVGTHANKGTNDFTLRQNLIGLGLTNGGPGDSQLGPIDYNISVLHADASLLFVKLLGIDFFPPSPPPLDLGYFDCDTLLPAAVGNVLGISNAEKNLLFPGPAPSLGFNVIDVPPGGSRHVVVNPLNDLRLHFSGLIFDLLGGDIGIHVLSSLATPFFCLVGVGPSDIPLIDQNHPENPFPTGDPTSQTKLVADSHPVPDTQAPSTGSGASTTPPIHHIPSLHVANGESLAICGTHTFASIQIDAGGTVTAATAADSTPGPDSIANGTPPYLHAKCNPGDPNDSTAVLGKLVLVATGDPGDANNAAVNPTIQVDGTLSADATNSTVGAPGNGGAGHGGTGGNGSAGNGGGAYGDRSTRPSKSGTTVNIPGTEDGRAGGRAPGAPPPGNGGGALQLQADTVTVTGRISADADQSAHNGAPGPGPCGTGPAGDGGGSGGGVYIQAAQLSMSGSGVIRAQGGPGGTGIGGGGGGGAGGIVKLADAITSGVVTQGGGADVKADGGGMGNDAGCTVDNTHPKPAAAQPGQGGYITVDTTPQARIKAFPAFWQSNAGALGFNFRSAATVDNNKTYDVALCGVHLPYSAGQPGGAGLDYRPLMPTGNNAANPCGGGTKAQGPGNSPATELGRVTLGSHQLTDGTITLPANTIPNNGGDGYWGVWATVQRPVPLVCQIFGFCPATLPPPLVPDTVVGVDSNAPGGTLTIVPGPQDATCAQYGSIVCTKNRGLSLTVNANDSHMEGQTVVNESGLDLNQLLCIQTDPGGAISSCNVSPPDNNFTLTGGDGIKHLHLNVVDKAGNVATGPKVDTTLLLDTTVPSANMTMSGPDGTNGFYRTAPTFNIDGYDDHPGGSSSVFVAGNWVASPPTAAYAYHFDSLGEQTCGQPCQVQTPLPAGTHQFFWTPIDAVGNRLFGADMFASAPFTIDPNPPISALTSVPAAPDGANGYFQEQPFIVLSAADGPGESGVDSIHYRLPLDGNADKTYAGPFQLPPGTHQVCWHAVDRASNVEAEHPCVPFTVDDAAPVVSLVGPAPNGSAGWYTTAPTINVTVTDLNSDATTGSGLASLYVSMDGAAFSQYGTSPVPITIPEGLHNLRAYAFDRSGQRSQTAFAAYRVDLSHPFTSARLEPPMAAQGQLGSNGWFRTLPLLVLRSTDGDQNAGVVAIQYSINGSPQTPYTGPVSLGSGTNVVQYYATDISGVANNEPVQTITVNVDVTHPYAFANSPAPTVWAVPAGPSKAKLNWTAGDDLASVIRVRVLVYNLLGDVVRQIDDGTRTVTPGVLINGSTLWDAQDDSLTGTVPLGIYYYRVVITDDAGNISQSGESRPIQITAR